MSKTDQGDTTRHRYTFFRDRESGSNLDDGLEFHAAGIVIDSHPKCDSGKELVVLFWHPFRCEMQQEWRSRAEVVCYEIPEYMLADVLAKYEFSKRV